jgi:hypothetical protein
MRPGSRTGSRAFSFWAELADFDGLPADALEIPEKISLG